jgi:formamidopyrimidine-DNA glycosylase
MPELPEVETIRSDLKLEILNKKIDKIEILDKKVIGKNNRKEYYNLEALKITKIDRQGKLLAFLLSNDKYLLVHLKMTGQLVLKSNKDIILMIDEVDKSSNNQLFLDFLGMLRSKYLFEQQSQDLTFKSVILAGVHDVKNLKLKLSKIYFLKALT